MRLRSLCTSASVALNHIAPPITITQTVVPSNGVDFRGKVILAPMVRSGELPSRLTSLKYGADLVFGPEVVDKAIIGASRRENSALETIEFVRRGTPAHPSDVTVFRTHPQEKGQVVFQIGTASPALAVEASRLVANDVAGIDVNAGCPLPYSTLGGMGSALLQTPDLFVSILEALVQEVGNPHRISISTKIRILPLPHQTESLVRRLVQTGIHALTVHCRTATMRPAERPIRDQMQLIAEICRDAGVACVINGDVGSREHAMRLLAEYGVDGAMIASAAESNFSVFRSGGPLPALEVAQEYLSCALKVGNWLGNTKYLLTKMVSGKTPEGKGCATSRSFSDLCRVLNVPDLKSLAAEADAKHAAHPE